MTLIALRRNEPIVGPGGFPTTRFSRYIEDSVGLINEQAEPTDPADLADINAQLKDSELLHYWMRRR